jgi:hypothetical protein
MPERRGVEPGGLAADVRIEDIGPIVASCPSMRYFTRGWANGELDDDDAERVKNAYRRNLDAIIPRLSEPARKLVCDVTLHDAIIECVRWRPVAMELTLTLATISDEAGYHTVTLTYLGAMLGSRRVDSLRAAARDRETGVLYDEVDIGDDGLLIHRLLFWPREELTIDFRELRLQITPREDRRVNLGGAFIEADEAPEAD